MTVRYKTQSWDTDLLVVQGDGPSLLGRDWIQLLHLDWQTVHLVEHDKLKTLLSRYSSVFQEGLGLLKGFKANIYVEQDTRPKYFKARSVPYSLKAKIEDQLDKLVKEGVIEPVQHAEWAAPIVPIIKSDNTVCICGDFKVTTNSKLDRYPIPKIEDLLATLSGGTSYTKLDLKQAYQQLELDEESRQFVVINTHKGLFRYNRLPFGISSAPGIFQRTMDNLM